MKDAYADQPSIPDYETAAEVFNTIKPYDGQPHIVPLRKKRGRDYGLVHKEGMYILLRNDQPVIKYMQPKPEEIMKVAPYQTFRAEYVRAVEVINPGTRGISRFFAHHGWQSWVPKLETTTGTKVYAPFVPGQRTLLIFDEHNKLKVEASHHAPVYTRHTSEQHKVVAQLAWEKMLPVANLALMQMEDLLQRIELHDRYGGGNFDALKTDIRAVGACSDLSVQRVVQKYALGDPISPVPLDHALPTFMLLATEVLNFITSRKWVDYINAKRAIFEQPALQRAMKWDDIKRTIQPDEFLRSYKYAVLKCCNLHEPNAKVDLGRFPQRLPRRVFL